jgi:hypothetical protein
MSNLLPSATGNKLWHSSQWPRLEVLARASAYPVALSEGNPKISFFEFLRLCKSGTDVFQSHNSA